MKKTTRSFLTAALAALLCLALAGCSLVSVNEEKDMAQVVAKVGDVEILKSEFVEMFDYYLSMYQMYGYDPTTDAESLNQFQDEMLNGVITGYVLDYKAKEQGLDVLTEEEKAEVEEAVASELEYLDEMVAAQLETELAEDPELDADARKAEIFGEFMVSYMGEQMDRAAFETYAREQLTSNAVRAKVQESFNETVTVSDEEIEAYFNELVAADTESYTNAPASYKAAQEYYEKFGGEPVGYAPEGYIRVKHIKLVPDAEIGTEYTDLQDEMTALSEELGQLTVEDEVLNAARIAEIKTLYAEKKAEAGRLYEAHYAQSKADAEEAYAKLQAGEAFDTVMMEYTKDANFTDYEVFQEKGTLMGSYDGDDTDWSDEVKAATLALTQKGSYTAVVGDDDGYHIVQYVDDEPAGARALADYRDAVAETVLANKQSDEWAALLEEWLQDTSVVTRYADRIRDVTGAVG